MADRGVPERVATLAAELGVLVFRDAYAAWVVDDNQQELVDLARTALDQLRTALTSLE